MKVLYTCIVLVLMIIPAKAADPLEVIGWAALIGGGAATAASFDYSREEYPITIDLNLLGFGVHSETIYKEPLLARKGLLGAGIAAMAASPLLIWMGRKRARNLTLRFGPGQVHVAWSF